jgi:hypothetical protein
MREPIDAVALHRRQFVLGPRPVRARSDWISRGLGPGSWLSHCPRLRVAFVENARTGAWALLGLAVQTLPAEPDPVEQIAASGVDALPRAQASWAGRWLLIGGGRIQTDAAALLGCLYARTAEGLWASSSPALLARVLDGAGSGPTDDRSLTYDRGVSWIVPPLTRIAGGRRLLPSQILHLDGNVERRPLVPADDGPALEDRSLDLLAECLVTGFRRLPIGTQGPWLSLSAGADSRVILAAAHRAGVEPRPFTRVMARVPFGDRLVPPRLAEALGYEHLYLRAGRPLRERLQLVADHSAGHVSRGDAEPLIVGVRDALEGISAGGECFPIANRDFAGGRVSRDTVTTAGAEAFAAAYREPRGSSAVAGLRQWLDWALEAESEIELPDRFGIEQHLAGWQCAKEQVYDMLRVERFFALNSARSYALLLRLEPSRREGSIVQRELIHRLAPELLEEPFNPPDRDFGRMRTAVARSREDPLHVFRRLRARLGR